MLFLCNDIYVFGRIVKFIRKEDLDLKKQILVNLMDQAKLPLEGSVRNLLEKSQPLKYLYTETFKNDHLEWNEIYKLPLEVVLDTRSREF